MASQSPTRSEPTGTGTSRTAMRVVAGIVGVLFIIAAILRVLAAVEEPPVTPQEGLDTFNEFALQQQLEEQVRQHVLADGPFRDPAESIVVSCSKTTERAYSCYVDNPAALVSTEIVTVEQSRDGVWWITSP